MLDILIRYINLHLELLDPVRQHRLAVVLVVALSGQAPLPELPPRQPDGLLGLCLFQLGQPLLLVARALLLHLAEEALAPPEEGLGRDGRAVELLVLLALGGEELLLLDLCVGVLAVLDELLGGVLEGGVEGEDHGHAEVLLDGVAEVGQQPVAVVADAEVRVRGGIGRGDDVEARRDVGVFVWVAHGEEEAGGFFSVFGGFFVGDVEGDFDPEFGFGDVWSREGSLARECREQEEEGANR
ncbi:hypothetical protein Trco_006511 [Trichoderma cornu-damae]|uniref:Uncharacterized protein n=1 Tax=Trichoderma cornu-damae TaxID=654480 RepID=A0A9P8TTT4_9HYPO|nr:hypothetical protein Trco_006511 [Trichoderma cornu-damae]